MGHMNRKAPKRDTIEPAIVKALVKAGASVVKLSDTGVPDLLVSCRTETGYRTLLMEVKTGSAKLTDAEEKFFDTWTGEVHLVRSPEYALSIIGIAIADMHLYID